MVVFLNKSRNLLCSKIFFQALEAAKRLHLSKTRMDMLKYELNKLKRVAGRGSPLNSTIININGGSSSQSRPSYAGISISDVRIPLMWKRKDHLKDVGDNRRFAVFCLARIGSQVCIRDILPYNTFILPISYESKK